MQVQPEGPEEDLEPSSGLVTGWVAAHGLQGAGELEPEEGVLRGQDLEGLPRGCGFVHGAAGRQRPHIPGLKTVAFAQPVTFSVPRAPRSTALVRLWSTIVYAPG